MENETVAAELQLHRNQVLQYTFQAHFTLMREYGITPSMSRRENCYDNAMAAIFLSILKTELIYRHNLKPFEEAKSLFMNILISGAAPFSLNCYKVCFGFYQLNLPMISITSKTSWKY